MFTFLEYNQQIFFIDRCFFYWAVNLKTICDIQFRRILSFVFNLKIMKLSINTYFDFKSLRMWCVYFSFCIYFKKCKKLFISRENTNWIPFIFYPSCCCNEVNQIKQTARINSKTEFRNNIKLLKSASLQSLTLFIASKSLQKKRNTTTTRTKTL